MSNVNEQMRAGVAGLVERLDPRVAEIVRLDLIQSVGNALSMQQRHQAAFEVESAKLDEFVQQEVNGTMGDWGAW